MMPPHLKLAAVTIIWVVTAILLLTMIGTGFLAENGFFAWILAISIAGIAGGVSSSIIEDKSAKNNTWTDENAESKKAKAKRGDESLAEMIALLDEDDAYELRQRIKQRLMQRIDEGTEEEAESFESLLGSRERQKRR